MIHFIFFLLCEQKHFLYDHTWVIQACFKVKRHNTKIRTGFKVIILAVNGAKQFLLFNISNMLVILSHIPSPLMATELDFICGLTTVNW